MYKTFEDIEKAYYGYFYKETPNKEEALKLAREAFENYPEHHEQIIMDLIVFTDALDQVAACKAMFKEAFGRKLWYPEMFIGHVLKKQVYGEEYQIWKTLKEEGLASAETIVKLDLPEDFNAEMTYPVFISLHGWGEDITLFEKFWHADGIKSDFIHVYIQSSQRVGSNNYVWDDTVRAKVEIDLCMDQLKASYNIMAYRIIGGFSQGATLALDVAFNEPGLYKGVVALNPNMPQKMDDKLLKAAKSNDLKVSIITGDQDQSIEDQRKMVALFKSVNLKYTFDVKENFGHWFPEDLSEKIDSSIQRIIAPPMDYARVLNKTLALYKESKFKEAYDFITQMGADIKASQAQIYNFRYSIASVMGERDLAYDLLRKAVMDKGYFYGYDYMQSDEDLDSMRGLDGFDEILEVCRQRELEAKENTEAKLALYNREDSSKPLLMALHGNGENTDLVSDYWTCDAFKNHLVALPQSSQIDCSESFEWQDIEKGVEELVGHYKKIKTDEKIDENDITLAGFSAGASVIMQAVCDGKITANKMILLSPWLPNFEDFEKKINVIKDKGITLYIICGDLDEDCFEGTNDLADLLDEAKIFYEYAVIEGMDHEYPDNFNGMMTYINDFFNE